MVAITERTMLARHPMLRMRIATPPLRPRRPGFDAIDAIDTLHSIAAPQTEESEKPQQAG